MRHLSLLLCAALVALSGCGGDDDSGGERAAPSQTTAEPKRERSQAEPQARGMKITLAGSEFGDMLFDSRRQAIYIFENDPRGKSVCYDECAEAWPPVFTDGKPEAGDGVDAALLGTVKRRGGRRQVSYAGKPLYFYAHEAPGEVRCHDVFLNGGYWWVLGADGKRLP